MQQMNAESHDICLDNLGPSWVISSKLCWVRIVGETYVLRRGLASDALSLRDIAMRRIARRTGRGMPSLADCG